MGGIIRTDQIMSQINGQLSLVLETSPLGGWQLTPLVGSYQGSGSSWVTVVGSWRGRQEVGQWGGVVDGLEDCRWSACCRDIHDCLPTFDLNDL